MKGAPATLPDLHDIVLPEPVSWAPQTMAWGILLALVVLVLGWTLFASARRRRANRYRLLALARLATIEQALADPPTRSKALAALPLLVKQTALAAGARSQVAALSGDPWLRYLDQSYGGTGFTKGTGRLLPTLAYATPAATQALRSEELIGLVDLVRQWIQRHRVRV